MASGGIKVKLGSVSSQASSTSSAVSKLNDKFRELRNTVDNVTDSNGLEGKAYRSARTFIKAVINPAITGVITAGDQLRDGVKKLHSDYTGKVDSRSWSVKELDEKIRHYKSEGDKLNHALDKMTGPGDGPATNSLETQISQNSYCLEKYERIKDHLIEFSGESASFFSGLNGTIADINAAAQQLQSKNITNPSCTVMKTPSSKDLKWAHDVEKRHREYIADGAFSKGLSETEKWMDHFESGEGSVMKLTGSVTGKIAEHSAFLSEHLGSASTFLKHLGGRLGDFMEHGGKYSLMRIGAILMFAEEMHDGEGVKKSLIKTGLTVAADAVVDTGVDIAVTGIASFADVFSGPAGTVCGAVASGYIDSKVNKVISRIVG